MIGVNVLPIAPAATAHMRWAWRRDPVSRCLHQLNHSAAGEVTFGTHESDIDDLSG